MYRSRRHWRNFLLSIPQLNKQRLLYFSQGLPASSPSASVVPTSEEPRPRQKRNVTVIFSGVAESPGRARQPAPPQNTTQASAMPLQE